MIKGKMQTNWLLKKTKSKKRLLEIFPNGANDCFYFFLIFIITLFSSLSTWAQEQDALFDMARQSNSLQDYYQTRLSLPSFVDRVDFDFGMDNYRFDKYPVYSDFGPTDYDILVNYSYLRFNLPRFIDLPQEGFWFRGFDYSGKSVALGKGFTVEDVNFSELQGEIYMQDMFMTLFTLWTIDIDFGFIRNRIFSDYQETGVYENDDNIINSGFKTYITANPSDTFSYCLNVNSNYVFRFNLKAYEIVESFKPTISLLYLLQKKDNFYIPKIFKNGDIWINYNPEKILIGFELVIDNTPKFTWEEFNTSLQHFTLNAVGYNFKVNSEISILSVDNSLVAAKLSYGFLYLKYCFSYINDPYLLNFGSSNGQTIGRQFEIGLSANHLVNLSFSRSYNFSEQLSLFSGSYNHPVHILSFSFRL